MLNLALEDPAGKQVLANDWRVFMTTHFALDPEQKRNLEAGGGIPADRVEADPARRHERRRRTAGPSAWRAATRPCSSSSPRSPATRTQVAPLQIKTFVCHVEI